MVPKMKYKKSIILLVLIMMFSLYGWNGQVKYKGSAESGNALHVLIESQFDLGRKEGLSNDALTTQCLKIIKINSLYDQAVEIARVAGVDDWGGEAEDSQGIYFIGGEILSGLPLSTSTGVAVWIHHKRGHDSIDRVVDLQCSIGSSSL
jgi:hypothetical protein